MTGSSPWLKLNATTYQPFFAASARNGGLTCQAQSSSLSSGELLLTVLKVEFGLPTPIPKYTSNGLSPRSAVILSSAAMKACSYELEVLLARLAVRKHRDRRPFRFGVHIPWIDPFIVFIINHRRSSLPGDRHRPFRWLASPLSVKYRRRAQGRQVSDCFPASRRITGGFPCSGRSTSASLRA